MEPFNILYLNGKSLIIAASKELRTQQEPTATYLGCLFLLILIVQRAITPKVVFLEARASHVPCLLIPWSPGRSLGRSLTL